MGDDGNSHATYLRGRLHGTLRANAGADSRGRADVRERDRVVSGMSDAELLAFIGIGGEPPFGVRGAAVYQVELLEHER